MVEVSDRTGRDASAPGPTSTTVVLMGVSGAGKSRVMDLLATHRELAQVEGDTFHPAANIQAMREGIPLTDRDRRPWLRSVAHWIGARERESVDAVVTCSALRREYRDRLRDGHPSIRFVHLTAPPAVLERRLAARAGHYMPASLLSSQLETLERLQPDEPGFEVDADRKPSIIASEIIDRVWSGCDSRTGC